MVPTHYKDIWLEGYTLLEKFWRISLYGTDDAIATRCDVKLSQIEGIGRKFSHLELSNSITI